MTRTYKERVDKGVRRSTHVSVTCPCGESFEVPPSRADRKKYCNLACKRKYATRPSGLTYEKHKENPTSFKPGERPSPATEFKPGADHVLWRGQRTEDIPGYDYLHKRVKAARGLASTYTCVQADGTCKGLMNWANISHKYLDIDDFMPLCQSHHHRYDFQGDSK